MTEAVYLEVTYRDGKLLAGYIYLPGHTATEKSAHTKEMAPGIIVDFNRNDEPIGIEIVSPTVVTIEAVNRVLRQLHQKAMKKEYLAPLLAG